MTTTPQLEEILFEDPASITYALLDGASIPDLLEHLDSLAPAHFCLYRGELKDGIEAVAPYLVQLTPGHPFTAWLLKEGWGRHYGVFAHAAEPLVAMRLHFRRSLRVYTEEGKALMFRYYDPRVLRVYLPTLNERETKEFFGPVQAFFAEAEDPASILRFSNKGAAALQHTRPIEGHQDWQPI